MKNKHIIVLLLVHLLLAGGFANAQSPNAIPYQSVVRNSAGKLLASQPIKLRISIHDVISTGTVVYSETHAVTTSSLGLINVNIGQGTIINGTLAAINWGTGAKFMQVEFDPAPPSTYIDMGTTQLNSVPYALYTSSTFQPGTATGQMLYWNGSTWITIPPGAPNQLLTYSSNGPVWQTPGFVTMSTAAVSNILGKYATCGGNIIASATPVIARGVCWSTSPNPTTYNSKTIDGTGFGSFVSNLTGLTPLTTYYMRAYAINGAGIFYANEISFTTFNATVPSVTTSPITSIMFNNAISGGNIINDGFDPVTARGVCWSTSPNPTTANSKTIDGTGTGTIVSTLSGLTAGTTYYVRAYATNSVGTAYGNEINFTTLILPTLSTSPINTITAGSAISGGIISNDGGAPVTARGVCWSTSTNPTTGNSKTIDGTGIGTFFSNLTGLTGNTTYYVRAYATSYAGTFYGNEISFTTLSITLTTSPINTISAGAAISGGIISNDGGVPVTARGVCWSTSPNPTTGNSKSIDGAGIGTFVSNLTSLIGNTTYYVRAYATSNAGTFYGNAISFTTLNTTLATLTTSPITIISYTTAISGGSIGNGGGAPVTARGVCWSTSPNPTTFNSKTIDSTGIGTFISNITGLTFNTTYYVRAYATSSAGTAYGNAISFTTLNTTVPTLTTSPVNSICISTAVSGGSITDGGGLPVTARGVCWSTSPNPTTANSFTTDATGTGTFVSNLTGLTLGTTYYVRAYATNSLGTTYGNEFSFTTFNTAIGQPYLGGILVYLLQPGDLGQDPNVPHGLIAAPSDQSTGTGWGCQGTLISGADGTAVGKGNQNTIDIMAGCTTSGIAARLCGDLVLGGYSDWYLPSKDELNKLYLNRVAIGGFAVYLYWSSTEVDSSYAWFQYFNANGTQSYDIKDGYYIKVRAVRTF